MLVSSIPLVFHHPRLAELADRVEGERYATHPHHLPDLVRLLTAVLLRGDAGANRSSHSAGSAGAFAAATASASAVASSTGSAGPAESAGAAASGSGAADPLGAAAVASGSADSWKLSTKVRLIVGGDLHMYADANICVSPPRAPGSIAATLASLEALAQGAKAAAASASASADDGTDTSGSGDGNSHAAASRLSSLFGRTSFRPQAPPPQCVGQMVTSGMTRGSVTAGSFKLWLFAFLNANVFPSVVEVPGSGAECSDTPKSLLAWLTSLVWPAESAPSVSEASASPASQTLQGGAGGGCDSADELVDTEDCVAAPSTQLNGNAGATKDSSAPPSPPLSAAAEKEASMPASSASKLPDFLLDFNLFFFGFNYGVVLLPPSPTFAYADSAFAPLLRSPASLQHPEAPMSTAASTRGANGANGSGSGSGLAASHLSASPSSSSSAPPRQSPSPSATSSASTDAHASKPYAPVLSSVRTPMRRLGNIVWYAEVGVPLPISWLILQVRCAIFVSPIWHFVPKHFLAADS